MKKLLLPLLVCGLFACKKDNDNPQTPETNAVKQEILDVLAGKPTLSEFSAAIQKVSITDAETENGLTIFAPSNDAIGAYDPGAKTMGKDLPDSTIKDHLVKGLIKLSKDTILTALSGKKLEVKKVGDTLYINGIAILSLPGAEGKIVFYTVADILSTPLGNTNVTVWDATQWSTEKRNGALLAGATVSLYLTREEYKNKTPRYTAVTNANGVATFTGVAPAEYFMVAGKGELSNTWPDANNSTLASADTLFQSTAEIANSPALAGATPGDFKMLDLNQDGVVNNSDRAEAPYRKITVGSGTTTSEKVLIGYPVNHTMTLLKTTVEADSILLKAAIQLGNVQKQLVIMDAVMSNDADCNGLASTWCAFDQFTFTASDATIFNIWANHYAVIGQLNRILLSLPAIQGDTLKLGPVTRSLRGLAYMQLATYFGGLPISTQITMPADISRSSPEATYAFIKNDLLASANGDLAGTDKEHYITVFGANALLARLSLNTGKYADAVNYSKAVINIGTYNLIGDTSAIYAETFNTETLYNIPRSYGSPFSQFFTVTRPGTVNFCPIIRYAEVLLINAEANVNLGDLENATNMINQVRMRRNIQTTGLLTADQAREAIRVLRNREFYREGQTFSTLVRQNLAAQELSNNGYKEYNKLLPIPLTYLNSYPNLTQNPGY